MGIRPDEQSQGAGANLDLIASGYDIDSSLETFKVSRGPWLPQAGAAGDFTINDPAVSNPFGQAQRQFAYLVGAVFGDGYKHHTELCCRVHERLSTCAMPDFFRQPRIISLRSRWGFFTSNSER